MRSFGTNNLPDCSNMCHESSGSALVETIGIGKGSVSLEDIHQAKLILVVGQNPGTNHPRMLSALEEAKSRGAKIISINPLQEAGLVRFKNPQNAKGLTVGTALADLHLPIRLNGDLAFFQAVGSLLIEWDALDHDFLAQYATGFEEYAAHVADLDWGKVEASTGLTRDQITEAARMIADSPATITCWAMGITQHHNAVGTIKEIVNVALLQGNIGKPGAGVCPVRGHSNVQGDRTMGIWERVPDHFLDAIRDEFGFEPPREHGLDTVGSIQALRDGKVRVFFGMGGNFVGAAPDTEATEAAMRNAALTVHVSTKLNRSHVVHGGEALILPALGRSEKDLTGGRVQRVTVEDSMSAVHASHGPLDPPSEHLRSEVDIICSLALATLGEDSPVPWAAFRDDYTEIRRRIARVVPGCASYEEKVDEPGGFVLPHPPRDNRIFETASGKAVLTVHAARGARGAARPVPAADDALARPVQHHDLRPRRPLPRRQGRTSGRLRQPRRPARPRLRRGRRHRPGQRVEGRRRARSPGPSASSPTTSRAAAWRPTTPRPTRSSRSTRRRRRATRRSTSRSWCGSTGPASRARGRASRTARTTRARARCAGTSRTT